MKIAKPEPRHLRYGSADVAGILGLEDAFDSKYSTFLKKVRQLEAEETRAMKWGRWLEPLILKDYEEHELGGRILSQQDHHVLESWKLASATLDAVALVGDEIVAVEAKTTREWKWKEVPAPVLAQCQWQMGCSGIPKLDVVVLYKPSTQLEIFRVEYEPKLFSDVLGIVRDFHENHVLTGIPPDVDGHDATTDALSLWEATDQVAEIDHLANVLIERAQLTKAIKSLEERKAFCDNQLKAALGECSVGTIGGEIAVKWSARTTTRFDQKRFKSEHADLAAKYLVSSGYRALTVRKKFSGEEGTDE